MVEKHTVEMNPRSPFCTKAAFGKKKQQTLPIHMIISLLDIKLAYDT
jgi:hypothetical protein